MATRWGAAARAAGTAGCYSGSRQNDSMLHTFSGVCLRSNPEALHTSVSFCPRAVLASAQVLCQPDHTRAAYRMICNLHPTTPGAQVHAPQLEDPAHWMVLYPSLNKSIIILYPLSVVGSLARTSWILDTPRVRGLCLII